MEDEQIMWEVRAGDVGKLEQLFDRHHRSLFHYFLHLTSSRSTAEDLVQEVFYRILKYRHSYQPEMSFRAWLFQVGPQCPTSITSARIRAKSHCPRMWWSFVERICLPIARRRRNRNPCYCEKRWLRSQGQEGSADHEPVHGTEA